MSMKFAKILHNAGAGDQSHSIEEIEKQMETAGFVCSSDSVKRVKKKDEIALKESDFIVLAGGDGTVRKMAKYLLKENLPIGLLPMGTANNIAKTLGLPNDPKSIIGSWQEGQTRSFDIGRVYGLGKRRFFLEGIGFGVFPLLMKEMKSQNKEHIKNPEKKLRTAIELLHDIVQTYKAKKCWVKIDGIEYTGKFLLAEVMNTRSIGPNLNLAPMADPGDGYFEVVLISEEKRNDFLKYLENKADDNERITFFHTISANKVELEWEGRTMHIDDELVRVDKPEKIEVVLQHDALRFLIPA
jgi:diacylglycerol kinase (ATP)